MKVLVCNAGSTSLKFKLFDMPEERVLATGKIERVGSEDNAIFHYQDAEEYAVKLEKQCIPTYIRRYSEVSGLSAGSGAQSIKFSGRAGESRI